MSGADPWCLYSTEGEPTHIARPAAEEAYCGERLRTYRPQGESADPSAFHARDHFCTECLAAVLGEQATAILNELKDK